MKVLLKIHSLSRLAERTELDKELSEEQLDFIDTLEPLNIEARYPSYKERLMKSLTKEYCIGLLSQTKELQSWIKNKLLFLAKRYKEMVAERLPLKALYLYGSYSKGNYREDSDIDIAIVVEHLDDNYFEDTPLLWKLRRKISNLIEPVLLIEDMSNPLYCDIARTGILI